MVVRDWIEVDASYTLPKNLSKLNITYDIELIGIVTPNMTLTHIMPNIQNTAISSHWEIKNVDEKKLLDPFKKAIEQVENEINVLELSERTTELTGKFLGGLTLNGNDRYGVKTTLKLDSAWNLSELKIPNSMDWESDSSIRRARTQVKNDFLINEYSCCKIELDNPNFPFYGYTTKYKNKVKIGLRCTNISFTVTLTPGEKDYKIGEYDLMGRGNPKDWNIVPCGQMTKKATTS